MYITDTRVRYGYCCVAKAIRTMSSWCTGSVGLVGQALRLNPARLSATASATAVLVVWKNGAVFGAREWT